MEALQAENSQLKQNNKDLESKLEIREDLKFDDNAYWRSSGDGPFCVPCWDGKKELMRLTGNEGYLSCSCGYKMQTRESKQRENELWRNLNR